MSPVTLALLTALIAGLAGGALADSWTSTPAHVAFALCLMAGVLAHGRGLARLRQGLAWTAVASLAWLLAQNAVDRALHPSLRTVLEQRLGGFALESPEAASAESEEVVLIEGTLRHDAAVGATGIVLRLEVSRLWLGQREEMVAGGVSLVVAGALAPDLQRRWTRGRRLRAPAVLRRPARYLNDGVPDLERALARRGIALVGTVKSGTLVEVMSLGTPWQEWGARMRAVVRASLAAHLPADHSNAAGVATAILIGDRAALGADLERRLQEAGTYHVLAISGGNIAILSGLVLGALARVGWRGRGAAAMAIMLLLAYGVVVEGGASVARATSMVVLYLAIRLVDQRTAAVNALALVLVGILVAEPLAIGDVGLWLTTGATLGILLGAARWPVASWGLGTVAALLVATVAAEAVLMPVSTLVFQRVTVAGLVLNFVAIPCMTVVQIGAMALVAADRVGVTAATEMAARLTTWGVVGLLGSAAVVDYAPWLTWRVPASSPWLMAFYYAALGVWWTMSRMTRDTLPQRWMWRLAGAAAAGSFVWIAVDPPSLARAYGDGRLHVTTIDVGQGDCLFVTFPNGRRLLIDAGGVTVRGDFDVGDRIVGPALRARGVRRLDYLAITHADPDHIGGAVAIVRDFAPWEIWQGIAVPGHEPTLRLHQAADRQRAAWRTLQRGDRLELGGVELHVLHPPTPDWERRKVRNDDSLVFELRLGDVSVLTTGDIGREVEHTLVAARPPAALVVMKVPHHGSATSSSAPFVAALSPAIATIGVGRGNAYGHPVPAVLERYRAIGAQVFRTDQDGQIDVVTDGREVAVQTFTGRRVTYKIEGLATR